MKKFFIAVAIFITMQICVYAEILPHNIYTVTTSSMSNKTLKTNDIINLIAIDDCEIDDYIKIEEGENLKVKILDYVKPKRGKRNGYFHVELIPTKHIVNPDNEEPIPPIIGKMRTSTPRDKGSIAKHAGVTIVGHMLKFTCFSQALAVTKGLVKPNEDTSRLKSAGENLYHSTPLDYIEKGIDFKSEQDGIIVLKLKVQD